jgi:hypothetical protein
MTYQKKLALFHSFDRNGNGFLNKKEFSAFMEAAGQPLRSLDLDLIFQKFDIDKSGDISIEEFECFLQDEMKRLSPEFHKERVINPKAHLSFSKSQYAGKNKNKAATAINSAGTSDRQSPNNSNNRVSKATPSTQQSCLVGGISPRLSKTEPARSRPVSGSRSSASAKSLTGCDNKLIDSVRGLGASNPLVTKSLDIPNKKAVTFSQGTSAEIIGSAGSTSIVGSSQQEDVAGFAAASSLKLSKDNITSANQASMVVDILQTQAHLESQLGSKYYK